MPSAVIFDFDGVIADTEPSHYEAFARVLPAHLTPTREHFFSRFVGLTDAALLEALFHDHKIPVDAETIAGIRQEKNLAYEQIISDGLPLVPGVAELIRSLSKQCPLAICSGARRPEIDVVLQRNQLVDYFAHVVSVENGFASKPDPAGYRYTLSLLRCPSPPSCVAIEDSPNGIAAAKRAGLRVIALAATAHGADQSAADYIARDLGEITTAVLERVIDQ